MPQHQLPPGYTKFQSLKRSFRLVSQPLEVMAESFERFGDTYCVYAGGSRKTIMTKNADFIQHVLQKNHKNYQKSKLATEVLGKYVGHGLLTSNGDYWLRQRRLIQPGFHIQKVKALYDIMKNTVDQFIDGFPIGKKVNIYPHMNRAAFEIVVNSLFDIDFPAEKFNELADIISAVQTFVVKEIRQPHKYWWFFISGQLKEHHKKSLRAREIIKEVIEERKESKDTFNDLLDMLLAARYEDNNEPMEMHQLIDEIFILIVAGHETTANALSWTLYLLSHHPEILQETIQETGNLSLEETVKSETLMALVQESMRLYPPAWITDRVSIADDEFGDYNYDEGTPVMAIFYALHRDPKYWDNPDEFRPSRFYKENLTKEQSKAFYPFGAGPRLCIGNNFAMAEMAIFVQAFLKRFEISPVVQSPKLLPLVTLRPDKILLNIQKK